MHIAILTWWISTEREVALRSGANMSDWAIRAGHTSEIFDFPSDIHRFLQRYQASILAKNFPTKNLRKHEENHPKFDLVIPVFHGIYWEDGQVTAFLKTLGCKYAYSDFEVHALCIDKYQTNLFLEKYDIKIPKTEIIQKNQKPKKINSDLLFPLIVKPNKWWSSIWISRIKNISELESAIKLIINDDILIQSCIEWREFTVWVYFDASWFHALPIIEIKTLSQDFFDYEEKYETDGSNEVFLEWENELQLLLKTESERIASILGCSGIIRIDYRYDWTDIYFLEVNTIPGFTSGSLVPKMWKKAGKSEGEFVEMISI